MDTTRDNDAYDASQLSARLSVAARAILGMVDGAGLFDSVLAQWVAALDPDVACFYRPTAGGSSVSAVARYPETYWSNGDAQAIFGRREVDAHGVGKAVSEHRVILIDDAHGDTPPDEFQPFSPQHTSEILAPVFVEGELRGVLIAARDRQRPYSLEDRNAAEILATTIESLYRGFGQSTWDEAKTLLARDLNSISPDDADSAIQSCLESLALFFPTRFSAFWLFNELDQTLTLGGFHPSRLTGRLITPASIGATVLTLENCLTGLTVRGKHTMVLDRVYENPRNSNQAFAREFGLDWLMSIPIFSGHRIIAVVNVYPDGPRTTIPDSAIQFVEAILRGFGRILEEGRFKRLEQTRVQYRVICRRLADSEPKEYWDAIAHQLRSDIGCEACSVFLRDDSSGTLVLYGTTGMSDLTNYNEARYESGQGLTGLAFQRNSPLIFYPDMLELKTWHKSLFRELLASGGTSRSLLFVPIADEAGNPIGLIRCANKALTAGHQQGRFTGDDIDRVTAIGVQASSYFRRD